jgi:hypothetical protein
VTTHAVSNHEQTRSGVARVFISLTYKANIGAGGISQLHLVPDLFLQKQRGATYAQWHTNGKRSWSRDAGAINPRAVR